MSLKLLAVLALFSFSTPAFAQFGGGGGGFGGGTGQGGFFGQPPSSGLKHGNYVESSQILVAISNSGKTVTAFSTVTGKTAKLTFKEKVCPFTPIVSGSMACFVDGKTAYAFGAKTGKWFQVEAEEPPVPLVSDLNIKLLVGSKIYICSAASTEWQVIDLEEGNEEQEADEKS